ncbi:MAG: transposase, partial [Chlamydiae bacterium SM23_39]
MNKYNKTKTSVFNIGYHLIWCPKYRRKVLVKDIKIRLIELLKEKANEIGIS